MRLEDELRFTADPRSVFAVLRDPAFVDRVCESTGALSHSVDVVDNDGPDGRVVVRSRRELPTDRVPEPAASMLSGRLVIEQEETWEPAASDGSRTGRIKVDVSGIPLKFTGKLRLSAGGGGTVQKIEGDLKASVPLFGKRIESAAEPAIRSGIRVQGETAQKWLSGA